MYILTHIHICTYIWRHFWILHNLFSKNKLYIFETSKAPLWAQLENLFFFSLLCYYSSLSGLYKCLEVKNHIFCASMLANDLSSVLTVQKSLIIGNSVWAVADKVSAALWLDSVPRSDAAQFCNSRVWMYIKMGEFSHLIFSWHFFFPLKTRASHEAQMNTSQLPKSCQRQVWVKGPSSREVRQDNHILCLPQGSITNPGVLGRGLRGP